jgi:hypothetical protein
MTSLIMTVDDVNNNTVTCTLPFGGLVFIAQLTATDVPPINCTIYRGVVVPHFDLETQRFCNGPALWGKVVCG